MEMLAEHADVARPRLFALYGLSRSGDDLIGWGMDFGEDVGALFYQPYDRVQWHSDSAEQVLATRSLMGEAHLLWLDPRRTRGQEDAGRADFDCQSDQPSAQS